MARRNRDLIDKIDEFAISLIADCGKPTVLPGSVPGETISVPVSLGEKVKVFDVVAKYLQAKHQFDDGDDDSESGPSLADLTREFAAGGGNGHTNRRRGHS